MTVGEIERTMSASERAEWYGYFNLRAGAKRGVDMRAGLRADALAGLETLRKGKR